MKIPFFRFMTSAQSPTHWFALTCVLLAALVLRWVFFTGYFGSDEVTYTGMARLISQGIWKPAPYIGSVRLGINLPVGFFMWLFGNTEFVANLWSLLCSLGEIMLVFLIARRLWGVQVAVLCALLLAFTPLHAHYAGRLMADAPLGFFITLSFYALFRGDLEASWRWHLVAGLAAGFVWWIKSAVAPVYVLVFAVYLIRERNLAVKWFIMGAGFVGMVTLNSLIFWIMQGDFLHVARITASGVSEYVQQSGMRTEPGYYLHYLLLDVRHTWLLGPLALLGLISWAWQGRSNDGLTRVAIWCVGLVGAFSLLVVSAAPLTFISKQVNYMLIFLAPLALMGGYGLSRLPKPAQYPVLGLIVLVGGLGTAMEQQVIRTFVANSKSALAYTANIPNRPIYGMANTMQYSVYAKIFAADPDKVPAIRDLKHLDDDLMELKQSPPDSSGFVAYAVIDLHTANWGKYGNYNSLASLPECWQLVTHLAPMDQGVGAAVTTYVIEMVSTLPGGQGLVARLESLSQPKSAFVYGIPQTCGAGKAAGQSRIPAPSPRLTFLLESPGRPASGGTSVAYRSVWSRVRGAQDEPAAASRGTSWV